GVLHSTSCRHARTVPAERDTDRPDTIRRGHRDARRGPQLRSDQTTRARCRGPDPRPLAPEATLGESCPLTSNNNLLETPRVHSRIQSPPRVAVIEIHAGLARPLMP